VSDRSDLERWTLGDLAARVALALADDYAGQSSGRVTEVPNPRTLRYYTTLGVLDGPAELRGRTAYYGPRHLAQIVAIKRLQSQGLALNEIQVQLHGLSDARLQGIARVPTSALAPFSAPSDEPAASPTPATAFWRASPAPLATPPASEPLTEAHSTAPAELQGLPLGDAILLFAPARPLDDRDREALRAAAAPLLKLLQTRGLVKPQTQEKP
jgi:DNA-binding transcriptional MerR regulator